MNEDRTGPGLTDEDPFVRYDAVCAGGLDPAQHERALTDDHPIVRRAAVYACGLSESQHERALTDDHWIVRAAAARIGGMSEAQLDRALCDKFPFVRIPAIAAGSLRDDQWEMMLTDPDMFVRRAATVFCRLTDSQRQRAKNDDDGYVRLAAEFSEKYGGVPVVPDIDAAILAAITDGGGLDMKKWHCGTTHCRAGWAIHLAGEAGYELKRLIGPLEAGAAIYRRSRPGKRIPNFFAPRQAALEDIRRCAASAGGAA
jgi:hypothetical protein